MIKKNNNRYQPGFFDVMLDVCSLAQDLNNDRKFSFTRTFMENALPNWRQTYGQLLHPCPYQVNILDNIYIILKKVNGLV
jgi:hypothetical protein